MEYTITISKDILWKIEPLKNEFRKDFLTFKGNTSQIIKGFSIIIFLNLIIIFILDVSFKTKLTFNQIIDIILNTCFIFSLAPIVLAIIQLLRTKEIYFKKYSYLINTFNVNLTNENLNLYSKDLNINLNLKNCIINKYEDVLILFTDKDFKIMLPLAEIKFGQELEKKILEWSHGQNN